MAAASPSSGIAYTVILEGGQPWGIRLQGGYEFAQKLRVAKVNPSSKAYNQGVQMGDRINSINGQITDQMSHRDALGLFQNANDRLVLELTRSEKQQQSVIPVVRVESPTGCRHSDSELLGGASSDFEMGAGNLAHAPPSTVIWSPIGYSRVKAYQPVEFDSTKRNLTVAPLRNGRVRNSASKPVSNFTDETLDVQSENEHLHEKHHPIATMRRRRNHNISDPGFAPKQSLRPPISDSMQLSRRSRQFNFWTHLYPRNQSEPCIVTRDEPAQVDSSKEARPPVFTSINEFQKHYGSCYARTMPVRRRLPVRPVSRPGSAPGSPQIKRVQFAPTENEFQSLLDDSRNFLSTISSGSSGATDLLSSDALFDVSRKKAVDKQDNHLDLFEPECIPTGPSPLELESDQSWNKPTDSVTSSLEIKLAPSSEDTIKKEGMTKQIKWKAANALHEDSDVRIVQNAVSPMKKLLLSSSAPSTDRNFGFVETITSPSVTTAKLDMFLSELPVSRSSISSIKTLSKNNQDVNTCNETKLAKISIKSTAREMPSYNHNDNQITDQYLSDNIPLKSESVLNQRDWYKQVFKALHKVDTEPEFPVHVVDKVEAVIQPRPRNSQILDAADGQNQSGNVLNAQNREICRVTKKGVEIPPCGLRYTSKPGRPNQNSEFNLNQPFPESSSASVSDYPSQEVHRTFQSMDLDMKRGKMSQISDDKRLLSPRPPDDTRKKDGESLLYSDKYWLELAGLANADDTRDPAVINQPSVVDKVAANSSTKSLSTKALALYSFKATSEKELSFDQGDIIDLIRPIDKNWFEAMHKGGVGFVPSNYIKVIAGSEEVEEKNFGKAVAKHCFTAKFPAELSFEKGDILTILRRVDGNWFEGKLGQRTGIFPISYVQPVSSVPVASLSRMNPAAGLDSPVSVSPRSSVLSAAAVPSGPTSPYDTFTSDYNPSDLEKSIFEIDKQFKNFQNLDIAMKDESLKRFFSEGIVDKLSVSHDVNFNPQGKATGNPQCSMKTICDLVVSDGKITSGMHQMQESNDQTIQREQLKNSVSKVEGVRSSTPSLHLLYEEPWYQVLYNYTPQHDDELDLREGDLIYLLERCDDGWCVGQSDRTKRVGTFPSNYVTQLG